MRAVTGSMTFGTMTFCTMTFLLRPTMQAAGRLLWLSSMALSTAAYAQTASWPERAIRSHICALASTRHAWEYKGYFSTARAAKRRASRVLSIAVRSIAKPTFFIKIVGPQSI